MQKNNESKKAETFVPGDPFCQFTIFTNLPIAQFTILLQLIGALIDIARAKIENRTPKAKQFTILPIFTNLPIANHQSPFYCSQLVLWLIS